MSSRPADAAERDDAAEMMAELGRQDLEIDRLMDADDAVLGYCPHGVNLDREFCPEGCRVPAQAMTAANGAEKLVRDVYDYLPHRVAEPGEKWGLLSMKLAEEFTEVNEAILGSPEFIGELGDLVEVCYALGGEQAVEQARLAKKAKRGGFDKLLVMRLDDAARYRGLDDEKETEPNG